MNNQQIKELSCDTEGENNSTENWVWDNIRLLTVMRITPLILWIWSSRLKVVIQFVHVFIRVYGSPFLPTHRTDSTWRRCFVPGDLQVLLAEDQQEQNQQADEQNTEDGQSRDCCYARVHLFSCTHVLISIKLVFIFRFSNSSLTDHLSGAASVYSATYRRWWWWCVQACWACCSWSWWRCSCRWRRASTRTPSLRESWPSAAPEPERDDESEKSTNGYFHHRLNRPLFSQENHNHFTNYFYIFLCLFTYWLIDWIKTLELVNSHWFPQSGASSNRTSMS